MQCPSCPEGTVTAFCRHCGKGVCATCRQEAAGAVHCRECAAEILEATAETIPSSPPSPQTGRSTPPKSNRTATPRAKAADVSTRRIPCWRACSASCRVSAPSTTASM